MFNKRSFLLFLVIGFQWVAAQSPPHVLMQFTMQGDVSITLDKPAHFKKSASTVIILFALPNGNSTAQTMGKKMEPGDNWHFDIQHIKAQTAFIRKQWSNKNIVVAYLENEYKSWPSWKSKHADFKERVISIVDTVLQLVPSTNEDLYLNGHSGGGRFIFSFIDAYPAIPTNVKRISFLDSNYGYDSTYSSKINDWLKASKSNQLNVFAYNDSVALYNDKPVVSATGGTWYRSRLMLNDLSADFKFTRTRNDSLVVYTSRDKRIHFFLKTNPDRKIYHTQQVELNGFIHSVFCGTKWDSLGYVYYGKRAYSSLIE